MTTEEKSEEIKFENSVNETNETRRDSELNVSIPNEFNHKDILNSPAIVIPRFNRYIIFYLILGINLSVNMDHGTIPAATNQLKESLEINPAELGLFGSLVYFGNLIGKILKI
jgi:hypothetical protein